MDDFAAAAMLRVIALGLRRLGIDAPAQRRPSAGARVPLADKRRLLEALQARHGAGTILRLGEGIRDARDEPALTALTLAQDVHDLVARWQRLERYVHSRHVTVVELAGADHVTLRHASTVAGESPMAAEDLLVFGLLVALAERIGTPSLRAHPLDATAWAYGDGTWSQAGPGPVATGRWQLRWGPGAPPARVTVREDGDWAQAAYRLLAHDPGQGWTVDRLAAALGTSPRSLQRHLGLAGQTFSSLWIAARLARSAELLARSQQSPAEVGYVCGFADQAHFTRQFKQHTALTPARYRQQFATGAGTAA